MKGTLKAKYVTLVASLGIAGLVGIGAYASFTASQNKTTTVSSGTMTLSLDDVSGSTSFTTSATDVAPGDTIERVVDLGISGSLPVKAITLTTTDEQATDTVLSTDGTNGLQVLIKKCSVAWTQASGPTYTCSGTESTVLASRAVIGSGLALSNLGLSAGDANRLMVKMSLPSSADDTFQGKTADIKYTFNATQRDATSK